MAASPLFQTVDELKERVRLAELPSSSPANEILDQVILESSLEFYRRLGKSRVDELVSYGSPDNPATENQILGAVARGLEVKINLCKLLRRLRTVFMDNSGGVDEMWNEEAPVRELTAGDVEGEILRCEAEIERDWKMIDESTDLGDEPTVQTWDGSPDTTPPCPGDTLRIVVSRRSED